MAVKTHERPLVAAPQGAAAPLVEPPKPAAPGVPAFRRVYVWELPVRAFHWVNALCLVVLAATGYLIGNPQAFFAADEPSGQFWFGWVRFLHFASAYLFLFNLLFRVYWSFVGHEHARWNNYIPLRREQWRNIVDVIKVDVLGLKLHRDLFVGHNYLASFTYFVMFLLSLASIATGFALYAAMSDFFLPQLFAWIIPLAGGDAVVRQWHHVLMWTFIAFSMFHIYLVVYHDVFEGRGTTSAIIGGWTYMKDEEIKYEKR